MEYRLNILREYAGADNMTRTDMIYFLGRADAFADYVCKSEYSIDRKTIAAFLGFELPKENVEDAD